ncbi:hypothetical protein Tco_0819529 [Tanacetum coccineum]|uniref:Uncharacterized protein n=1 Tax=Tanacetum coccineum TaxID=301880 RepID=A0ABQ5A6U1_9ASTR
MHMNHELLITRLFRWVSDDEPEAPQSPGQAPLSPNYVPGPEHPPSPDYVPGPEEPGQAPLSPDYIPEPKYPEYLVPSYVEVPIEDQPDDASPTALSSGYSSRDELMTRRRRRTRMRSILLRRLHCITYYCTPVSSFEAKEAFDIAEFAPTPPRSLDFAGLGYQSYSTTYGRIYGGDAFIEAAKIWLRAASPSTHHQSEIPLPPLLLPSTTHKDDIPEDMPLRKRARFSAPTSRFEVGESSAAAATRQAGQALTSSVDYGFIDTVDASIRASEIRAMIVVEVVNEKAWAHSKSRSQAMEAQFRALQRDVDVLQRQRIRDEDRLTSHIRHKHDRFRELVRTIEAGPQDGLANAGSSC